MSARIKKLIKRKLTVAPKIQEQTSFQTLSAILGLPRGHFVFCKQCDVAGGERMPLVLLGWYSLCESSFGTSGQCCNLTTILGESSKLKCKVWTYIQTVGSQGISESYFSNKKFSGQAGQILMPLPIKYAKSQISCGFGRDFCIFQVFTKEILQLKVSLITFNLINIQQNQKKRKQMYVHTF